jgi:monoamine oxidase/SAM-dependent methyltransferase
MKRIAIVGGGPGGLFTARFLTEKLNDGIDITLFEAAPRLGGKVLTARFEKSGIAFEGGTAELYDYSMHGRDPLRELVKELGLTAIPFHGGAVALGDRILRCADDIRRAFGMRTLAAIRAFQRQCAETLDTDDYYEGSWNKENASALSSITFEELLQRVPDEAARRYLLTAVRSDIATEPTTTNALNGIKNVLMDNHRYVKLYAIAGGLEQLITKLAPSLRAKILLRHRVRAISRSGKNYVVHAAGKRYPFDAVVLAVPDCYLGRISFEDGDLRRAIQAHCRYYHRPAHYLRVTALFRTPFWRRKVPGNYFMIDAFGGACVYDESSRFDTGGKGVLSWLLAGQNAMMLSNQDDDSLCRKMIHALPCPLRDQAARELKDSMVHRWIGGINALPGGVPQKDLQSRHLPEPNRHPDILVVGDYLFDCTLNGVMDSADYVTDVLLTRSLAERRPKTVGISRDYFDLYDGNQSYEESFHEYFDARYTLDLIRAIWNKKPPYRLLDVGSASGLTLKEFQKLGAEAWGVEKSAYIHRRTPTALRPRNVLGDVRSLPFESDFFHFAYETCLCYLPPRDVEQAIRELHRVVKIGVFFGGITSDMTREVIEKHDLLRGVRTLMTLWQWSELFLKNGFRLAAVSPQSLERAWRIETKANEGDFPWYTGADAMRLCFYTKISKDEEAELHSAHGSNSAGPLLVKPMNSRLNEPAGPS